MQSVRCQGFRKELSIASYPIACVDNQNGVAKVDLVFREERCRPPSTRAIVFERVIRVMLCSFVSRKKASEHQSKSHTNSAKMQERHRQSFQNVLCILGRTLLCKYVWGASLPPVHGRAFQAALTSPHDSLKDRTLDGRHGSSMVDVHPSPTSVCFRAQTTCLTSDHVEPDRCTSCRMGPWLGAWGTIVLVSVT